MAQFIMSVIVDGLLSRYQALVLWGGLKASRWPILVLVALILSASQAIAQVPGDSVVLEGDFIRTGVSNNGTLGVGGNTSPGFIFDATGTRDFNTANDYLTPGSPHEGFSLRYDGSSVYVNNNTGTTSMGPTSTPTTTTSSFDNSATWTGSVTGEFTVQHDYGLDNDAKKVQITTTITAQQDLTNVRFSRWIDPDSGGTSSINTRGNTTLDLAPEDWVNSESETNGATLGLFSSDPVAHNTGIDPSWSTDPDFYIAGTGDTTGDHTIGIGFDIGDLLNGDSITFVYFYAVSASADDFDLSSDYASRAVTGNQLSIATFLDELGDDTPADLSTALGFVTPLTDPEFRTALDQFSGAMYGSIALANLQHTSYYLSQLAGRFRSRMTPGNPLSSSGFADATKASKIVLVTHQSPEAIIRGQSPSGGYCRNYHAWLSGYGLGGYAQSDGNADGFDYGLGGTQFAVEHGLNANWQAGFWGNMAWGSIEGLILNEQAILENYHFGGHLVGFDGLNYWIGLAGTGYNNAEITRTISAGGLNQTARGVMDSLQANAYLERGRSYCHQGWRVQPYAALQYVYLRQNSLAESGVGALNLSVGGLDAHSLRSILGGRVATSHVTNNGRLFIPELRAAWIHEFLDTNQVINSNFSGTSGAFAIRGINLGRDWALLGSGVNLQFDPTTRLFANYDVQINDQQTLHVGSGGIELLW